MNQVLGNGPEGLSLFGPESKHYVVIGDNHGRPAHLEALREAYEPVDDVVFVTVGDVINKGPDSKKSIGLVMDMSAICLMGNCEWMMLRGMKEQDEDKQGAFVSENYKRYFAKTCESYGVCKSGVEKVTKKQAIEVIRDLGQAILEEGHHDYFANLKLFFKDSGLVVVHAGLLPDRSWGEQKRELKLVEYSIKRQGCDWGEMPVQISDVKGHKLSKDPHVPQGIKGVLVTGHHHSDERLRSRITHDGQRVRLGASMKEPMLVYDSRSRRVMEF